jgi:hypothetical protein
MNIPEQGQFVCVSCGRKYGYQLIAPPPTIWHYATCTVCHAKGTVTQQVHPLKQ